MDGLTGGDDGMVHQQTATLADILGYVQGAYYSNGQGVQLNTNATEVRVSSGNYQVGLVEFDLAGLDPTARIASATLSLTVNLTQYGSTGGTPQVAFYGFQGDGILGPNDFRAADSTSVGTLSTTTTGRFDRCTTAPPDDYEVGAGRTAKCYLHDPRVSSPESRAASNASR